MKPPVRKFLTHAACVAVGLGLAALWNFSSGGFSGGRDDDAGKEVAGDPMSGSESGVPGGKSRSSGERGSALRSSDFRKAWDAIAKRNLTPLQRCQAQIALLKKWAEIDLEGAMAAALESPWDGDFSEGGVNSLVPAFAEAFRKNPIDAWNIIQSGRLGLGSALFRWQWVSTVAKENPMLVVSYFGEFSPGLRKAAIGQLVRNDGKNPEVAAAILKMLREMPADAGTKELAYEFYKNAPVSGAPQELVAQYLTAATEVEKMLALQALAASLRGADMNGITNEWSKLPGDAQKELLRSMLGSPLAQNNPVEFLNLAIQAGDWDILRDSRIGGVEGLVANYAKRFDPISIAEWGLGLPERPETVDIYRRAVTGYIDKNPVEAREWILSIPEGDWRRERALLEYSQNSLWYKKDPEASQWAIDRITDPKAKGTAISWRQEWAQRNGRP